MASILGRSELLRLRPSCLSRMAFGTSAAVCARPKAWRTGANEFWGAMGKPKPENHGGSYDYRIGRREKVARVNLPKIDATRHDDRLAPDEVRSKMKEAGVVPHRPWNERPLVIMSTSEIFDEYVPFAGDGDRSLVDSVKGAGETIKAKVARKMMALRRIRSYHPDFDFTDFAQNEAQDIYLKTHQLMTEGDHYERLLDYVTEKAYVEILHNVHLKTIRWQYVRAIEKPEVVHARVQQLGDHGNYFAQVTVRFHSEQLLAVYDRFGRLLYGSEAALKTVLEYCVFEQHLTNETGRWRLHGKIFPEWMHRRDPVEKTFVKPTYEPESEEAKAERKAKQDRPDEDEEEPVDKEKKKISVLSHGTSMLDKLRAKYLNF